LDPPRQLTDKWLRSSDTVTDAPEHMSASYTQLNVPEMGFAPPLVGRSIGAVAVHEVIPNGFDVILVRENLPFIV
jgi:hypothetical protein